MGGFFQSLKNKFSSISKSAKSPIRHHPHKRIDNLNKSVEASFTNLRKDMEHVSKLLHHYDGKIAAHDSQFQVILNRLSVIEKKVSVMGTQKEETGAKELELEEQAGEKEVIAPVEDSMWETLTETQQKLCWKLAALQKEMPSQWISLKYLAQELYPDKDYNAVRSTLSQFVAGLEDLGLVKRKRKGKQAYVVSTSKNPCNKKKMPVVSNEVEMKKQKK